MTCIISIIDKSNGSIWMGSDSSCNLDDSTNTINTPKVFIKDNFIFGIAGYIRLGNIIQYIFDIPENTEYDIMRYMVRTFIPALIKCLQSNGFLDDSEGNIGIPGSCILVGYQGRVFQIDSNFQIFESTNEYHAIGSGAQIALGSLYALMTPYSQNYHSDKLYTYIDVSLNAASKFSVSVNQPFKILQLKFLSKNYKYS
jgi:ATP-dependent protease HslVU (ClpYQ) peptidase subunit